MSEDLKPLLEEQNRILERIAYALELVAISTMSEDAANAAVACKCCGSNLGISEFPNCPACRTPR